MTLEEIAKQYRENAERIKVRIAELKKQLPPQQNHAYYKLSRRITILQSMAADLNNTAYYLETYYNT